MERNGALNNLSSPSDGNGGTGESPSKPMSVDSHGAVMTHGSESALGRLIRSKFAPDELPSLLETTLTHKDVHDEIRYLSKDDAQAFVDVINEALDQLDLSPGAREICLRQLYRTCGYHALLPKALKIPICYDRTKIPSYRGGYADVWKGEYCGQEVAVKVIRTYSNSDLQKIVGRFCKEVVTWKSLQHPNVLLLIGATMSEDQFAMVSGWMANGNINEFVKANPEKNRLNLLGDVARGLMYIHRQGMVHGDLKGANVVIDQTGHARLADFGLLTIVTDHTNLLPPSLPVHGGTARWMGPELIAPQEFGLKASCPTKFSDCYSLGMVVYETITGNLPFHEDTDLMVAVKVSKGERPCRTVGFTEGLWRMLGRCWASQPSDRPSVEDVLQCLDMCSKSSAPSSPGTKEGKRGLGLYSLIFGGQRDHNPPEYSSIPSDQPSSAGTNDIPSDNMSGGNSQTRPGSFFGTDYCTKLYNFLQVNGGVGRARWETVKTGPQDRLTWTAICYVDGVEYARASGPTLAQAEETAAHVAHRALSFQPFRHIVGLTVVI